MNSQDIKTVTLVINSDQAKKKLDEINRRMESVRVKREEAFNKSDAKGIEIYTRELRNLEQQATRMQSRAQTVEKVLRNLDRATPKELKRTIREINKELEGGTIERGSREWNVLTEALGRARSEFAKIKEEQRAASSNLSKEASLFGQNWVGFTTILNQASGAISSLASKIFGFYEQYAEMQEHMASVKKYAGLTNAAVRELNESFKAMDTRTSREQLNDLAGDAGRLGIQGKKGILEFVEAADQINVALGEDLGEDAVKNIGKLAQLFGDADRMGLKQAMLSTGSVINELAQSSSASEGYLMDFTARLAGVGHQAGMTQAQVMAFGSILDQGMVNVEKGATALQNTITALYRKPEEMARVAGLKVKEFTELLKKDGNAAVMEFVSALSKSGNMEKLAPMLDEMKLSGAGVTQTLSTLAANLDKLRQTQDQATQAFRKGSSITNEFNTANNTAKARLEQSAKKLREVGIELGERLAPAAEKMLTIGTGAAKVLSTLMGFTASNAKTILVLAGNVAFYTAAVKAATVWSMLQTKWETAKNAVMRAGVAIQHAMNAAMAANPYALAAAAAVAVASAIYLWCTRTKELTVEQRRQKALVEDMTEVQKKASEATAASEAKIRLLTAIVHDNNRKLSERRAAINALKEIIPGYVAEISKEGTVTRENTNAVKDYIAQLRKKAMMEAALEKSKDILGGKIEWEESLGRRKNAVSLRRQRLANFLKANPVFSGGYSVESLMKESEWSLKIQSALNTGKVGEMFSLAKDLKEAMGWVSDAEAEIETLDKRFDSMAKTAGKLGATLKDVVKVGDDGTGTTGGGSSSGTGSDSPSRKDDPVKASSERLAQQAEASRLAAQTQYEAGITEHREYAEQLMLIDEQLYASQRDLYEKGTPEWVEMERKRLDSVEAQKKQYNAWSISDIDRQEREETDNVHDNYARGLLNEEQYQHALTDVRLKYLKQRADMSRNWGQTEEADKYEIQYEEASRNEQIQRQKEFWQKVGSFKSKFLRQSEEEQRQAEMAFADKLHEKGLLSEEEYQKAKAEIEKKYSKDQATDLGRPADAMSQSVIGVAEALKNLHDKLEDGKASWRDYAAAGMAAMQTVMACMQSASQLMQANLSLEEAKITKRYDREIEAAGSNTAKGKKLEEQKQKEIAKIKTKYNKKQMAIEVAQAVAQTAMNAIMAYGSVVKIPVVGPALAVAAAAAATAAGMIQIATIKKQHAAEAAGYYEGGFTGGNSYRRTAGIVHEGEFVANHQAVNNPNVLPILRLIDHAQRTNRIASLTAADVSRAIAAPMATSANTGATASAPALQVVDKSSAATADTLQRLNEQLDKGIKATVVIDGPDGFARQWRNYNKMKQQ